MVLDNLLLPKRQPTLRSLDRRQQWRLYQGMLIVNDLVFALAACWIAWLIRFDWGLQFFQPDGFQAVPFYLSIFAVLAPLWLVLFAYAGLYSSHNLLGGTQEYTKLFWAICGGMMFLIVFGFLVEGFIFSRGWLVMTWGLATGLTAFGRFSLRHGVYALRRRGFFLTPAVLVGSNAEALSLALQLLSWETSGLALRGIIATDDNEITQYTDQLPYLGALEDLDQVVSAHNIGEIVLATSALSRSQMVMLFEKYGFDHEVNLRLSSGLFEIVTTGLAVKEMGFVPLITVNQLRLDAISQFAKRALEVFVLTLALLALAPIWIVLALLVRISSPGPVLYRRRVMGVNGHMFDAFKFRTMVTNGDEVLAKYPDLQAKLANDHKLVDDPRVTKIGRILRRFSLDETPQLLNVLRGEMALIGPRMIHPDEMEKFGQWGLNLLTVRPGITGLWQVSGRSDLDYADRVRLDMHYIRNWSIWMDLSILVRTPFAMLKGEGAY